MLHVRNFFNEGAFRMLTKTTQTNHLTLRGRLQISLKFVPYGQINNNPALVQIMAWRRLGDKLFSEPIMALFTDAYMRHSASMS